MDVCDWRQEGEDRRCWTRSCGGEPLCYTIEAPRFEEEPYCSGCGCRIAPHPHKSTRTWVAPLRPHKVKDMRGLRFGRLVVIEQVPPEQLNQSVHERRAVWRCRCDCGEESLVRGSDLRAKGVRGVKSCGCGRTGRPPKIKPTESSSGTASVPHREPGSQDQGRVPEVSGV